MADGLLKKIGNFRTHHHILFFSLIMLATVLFVRLSVQFYNPNPVLLGFELHHFDYGIIMLIIAVLLLLFGNQEHHDFYLIVAAIGTGLVLDDYIFIKKNMVENHALQTEIYNSTIPYAIVAIITSLLVILFINSLQKRRLRRLKQAQLGPVPKPD